VIAAVPDGRVQASPVLPPERHNEAQAVEATEGKQLQLACLHFLDKGWRSRACVCFEAEGEPEGRKGIIRGQGLHADNFDATSNIRRRNLSQTHLPGEL
jgi:hypothetical protein